MTVAPGGRRAERPRHLGDRVHRQDVPEPLRPQTPVRIRRRRLLPGPPGRTFASSALMDPITKASSKPSSASREHEGVDLVTFEKGQRKDDIAHEYLDGFGARRESSSSARPRRRPRPFAPRSDQPGTPAGPTPGSCVQPSWSTSTTSTASTPIRTLLHQVHLVLPLQRKACINGNVRHEAP